MKTLYFTMLLLLSVLVSHAETVVWLDNFDDNGATNRWKANSSGTWMIGPPAAGPATNSLGYRTFSGTNCASTQGYSPSGQTVLLICTNYNGAATLQVPAASQYPRLRFWQWFNIYNAVGYIEISTNRGTNWIQISPPYPSPVTVPNNGNSGGVWSRPSLDLSPYAGQNIQIALYFGAGGPISGSNSQGWYVDDVA